MVIFLLIVNYIFKRKKSGVFFFFVILTFLSSIRCNFGSDYYNYYFSYNTVTFYYNSFLSALKSRYQSGFISLSYIIKTYIGNENAIFVVISVFVSVMTWFLFIRYSKSPRVSSAVWILSGFYLIANNLLKQYIAMTLLLWAFFLLRKKKYFIFVILVLLASIFHVTALLVVPLYIIAIYLHTTYKTFMYIVVSGVLLSILLYPLLRVLTKVSLFSRYQIYLSMVSNITIRFVMSAAIMLLFYTIIVLILLNYSKNFSIESKIYLNMIMISILITIISLRFFYLTRIAYYFMQFLPFVISNIFSENIENLKVKKMVRFVMTMLLGYCFIFTAFSGENNYYNYSTIFNDNPVSIQDFISR